MSALPKVFPNGPAPAPGGSPDVKDIMVKYDYTKKTVSVKPDTVDKGTSACFKNPDGKLTIVFLSPTGKETDTVTDTDVCELKVGGSYHFKCFFTDSDGHVQAGPDDGGVIIVSPTRP
jgi:hypothetical protein